MTFGEGTAQKPSPEHRDQVAGAAVDALMAITPVSSYVAVKHTLDAENDIRAVETDRNDSANNTETPLAASKHTGGLSLERVQVEEGHCEMRMAGQKI